MGTKKILLHIFGCIAFLSLPAFFSPHSFDDLDIFTDYNFQRDFITYVLIVVFFYFHHYYLLPKLYFNKKYWLWVFSLIICLLIIQFLPQFIMPFKMIDGHEKFKDHFHDRPPRPKPNKIFMALGRNFFLFVSGLFVSMTIRISQQLKHIKQEKTEAELSYLKAQINPHFLFNTLNSVYALALNNSPQTADAVVKLSGMMRYVLTYSQLEFVSLDKEIKYISDYIDLQKLRISSNVTLSYEVNGDLEGLRIAPLLLIPFIENAFKHGVNAEDASTIEIKISVYRNVINFNIKNNIVRQAFNKEDESGIGSENTRLRLNMIYPQKHLLNIEESENVFSISLQITLI